MNDRLAHVHATTRHPQRGAALISALLMLLVVTVLGMALNTIAFSDAAVSTNTRGATQALVIAESGLAHARGVLLQNIMVSVNDFLKRGDGQGCSGDELAGKPTGFGYNAYPPVADLVPATGRVFGGGRYLVRLCDDHVAEQAAVPPNNDSNTDVNGRFLVQVTGIGADGASVTVEALMEKGTLMPAVFVDGVLRIEDKTKVLGTHGWVHATELMEVKDESCAELGFFSAAFEKGEKAKGGPACGDPPVLIAPAPPLDFDPVNPTDYKALATWILGADGWVYDKNGVKIAKEGKWKDAAGDKYDWHFHEGEARWHAGEKVPEGIYFVEGNMDWDGKAPKPGQPPMTLTFIATGFAKIGGDAEVVPAMTAPHAVAMLAGTDVELNGKGTYVGLVYAQHQMKIDQDPEIFGQVIAMSVVDAPGPGGKNLVKSDKDKDVNIKGHPKVTYNGGGLFGDTPNEVLRAWRECRGPNPANPCN